MTFSYKNKELLKLQSLDTKIENLLERLEKKILNGNHLSKTAFLLGFSYPNVVQGSSWIGREGKINWW